MKEVLGVILEELSRKDFFKSSDEWDVFYDKISKKFFQPLSRILKFGNPYDADQYTDCY